MSEAFTKEWRRELFEKAVTDVEVDAFLAHIERCPHHIETVVPQCVLVRLARIVRAADEMAEYIESLGYEVPKSYRLARGGE